MREKLLCNLLALDVPATTLPITHAPGNVAGSPLSGPIVALLAAIVVTVVTAILLLVILSKKHKLKT